MTCRVREYNGKHATDIMMSGSSPVPQEVATSVAQAAQGETMSPITRKSKSDPSTPNQRSQSSSSQRKSPMTNHNRREESPGSIPSTTSRTPPATWRPVRRCRYEAGMAQAKRRVPYSLGPEKLEAEPAQSKRTLSVEDSVRLTSDMQELYQRLVPSPESEARRSKFVRKLEGMLQVRWPDSDINVRVFGSTGNCLGTSDSDVDICITTDCKEIENVCLIAELLESYGLQRIVCVSSAKIPIVKAWDPEYQVACDMNVNNPIALENTHMIRSYVSIDDRVRPLAMIVKYWAKRRILNDAALGGTLSSYTWICMVLNFLQTRQPPILPALQQKPGLDPVILNGVNVAFDKDLEFYNGFGSKNTTSLGDLLFDFFHYFGHELDFEGNALSVRLGKVIPKSQKAWHLLQDNRLCVEEPFNISRNLANTADDTSMRGIHLDLRRAFRFIAEGNLAKCCEQFVPAPEGHRHTATFIHPTARPIIPQAPAQAPQQSTRGNRNSYRGPRAGNRASGSRRASNPTARNPNYLHDLPFQMTPQELQLQAQHQQHLLHDQLFQQYQYLQLQEQELRMQLYQQNLRQRGMLVSPTFTQSGYAGDSGRHVTMSPTLFQNRFGNASPFMRSSSPSPGVMTNPASPLLGNVMPDNRRSTRRTSMTASLPAGSLRAHSQPARVMPAPTGFTHTRIRNDHMADGLNVSNRRSSFASQPPMASRPYLPVRSESGTLYDAGRKPAEFVGFYVGQSPSLAAQTQSTTISPLPSHAGLAIHNGGLSPRLSSFNTGLPSGASSPSFHQASLSDNQNTLSDRTLPEHHYSPKMQEEDPSNSPKRRSFLPRGNVANGDSYTVSTSTSEDLGIDTPATSEDQFPGHADKFMPTMNGFYGSRQAVAESPVQLQSLSIDQAHFNHGSGLEGSGPGSHSAPGSEQDSYYQTPISTITTTSPSLPQHHEDGLIANGASSKRKKTKAEKTIPALNGTTNQVLSTRPNGQDTSIATALPTRVADGSSSWQTQKKKKKAKKPNKSEGDASIVNHAGGEILPANESMRKGG